MSDVMEEAWNAYEKQVDASIEDLRPECALAFHALAKADKWVHEIIAKHRGRIDTSGFSAEGQAWMATFGTVENVVDFDPPLYLAARADETDSRDTAAQAEERLNPYTRLPQGDHSNDLPF